MLARPANTELSPRWTCFPPPSRNHSRHHPRQRRQDMRLGTEVAPAASEMSSLDIAAPRKPRGSKEPPGWLRPAANYPDEFGERVAEPVTLPRALPMPAPREIAGLHPDPAPNQLGPCLCSRNALPTRPLRPLQLRNRLPKTQDEIWKAKEEERDHHLSCLQRRGKNKHLKVTKLSFINLTGNRKP